MGAVRPWSCCTPAWRTGGCGLHQATVLVEAGFQVVRPDLRGYGSTPSAGEPWSSVSDVVALLDSLGLDRFSLVGASAGVFPAGTVRGWPTGRALRSWRTHAQPPTNTGVQIRQEPAVPGC